VKKNKKKLRKRRRRKLKKEVDQQTSKTNSSGVNHDSKLIEKKQNEVEDTAKWELQENAVKGEVVRR